MRILQTSAPSREPVLLDEVKEHLRIDSDHEDAKIVGFIASAREAIETATGLYLIDRNIDVFIDGWGSLQPLGSERCYDDLDYIVPSNASIAVALLPLKPVSVVNAITLIDEEGTETEWNATNYQFQPGLEPKLRLANGASWPIPSSRFEGIKISVTAGYGSDWNVVPEALRQAIMMMATKIYVCRGDNDVSQVNLLKSSGAGGLLQSFRRVRI